MARPMLYLSHWIIARLASLVPKPRFHLTRFHGVFAPNSKHRAMVTKELNGEQKQAPVESSTCENEDSKSKMNWAMLFPRVFNIDITICKHCQGRVRIIACIEDAQVIKKILSHINERKPSSSSVISGSGIRAPPDALSCFAI